MSLRPAQVALCALLLVCQSCTAMLWKKHQFYLSHIEKTVVTGKLSRAVWTEHSSGDEVLVQVHMQDFQPLAEMQVGKLLAKAKTLLLQSKVRPGFAALLRADELGQAGWLASDAQIWIREEYKEQAAAPAAELLIRGSLQYQNAKQVAPRLLNAKSTDPRFDNVRESGLQRLAEGLRKAFGVKARAWLLIAPAASLAATRPTGARSTATRPTAMRLTTMRPTATQPNGTQRRKQSKAPLDLRITMLGADDIFLRIPRAILTSKATFAFMLQGQDLHWTATTPCKLEALEGSEDARGKGYQVWPLSFSHDQLRYEFSSIIESFNWGGTALNVLLTPLTAVLDIAGGFVLGILGLNDEDCEEEQESDRMQRFRRR